MFSSFFPGCQPVARIAPFFGVALTRMMISAGAPREDHPGALIPSRFFS